MMMALRNSPSEYALINALDGPRHRWRLSRGVVIIRYSRMPADMRVARG